MADLIAVPSEDEDFDAVIAPVRKRKPRSPSKAKAVAPVKTVIPPAQPLVSQARYEALKPVPAPLISKAQWRPLELLDDSVDAPVEVTPPEAIPIAAVSQPEQMLYEPAEPIARAARSAPVAQPERPAAVSPVRVQFAPSSFANPVSVKPPRMRSKKLNLHHVAEFGLAVALIACSLWAWQLHSDKQALSTTVVGLQSNPQQAIQKQADDLISSVAKLVTLPSGEAPTVASVSDVTQARQQSAFFKDAQNGDKVLMYIKAKQAILYRPTTNNIILVAPLTFDNANAAPAGSATSGQAKP